MILISASKVIVPIGMLLCILEGSLCFRQESKQKFNAVRFLSRDPAVETKLCQLKGQFYVHGDFVPTSDPCRNCMCFRGDVLCWKQECPPPGHMQNCKEVKLITRCCPVYACPAQNVIPMYSDTLGSLQPAPQRQKHSECHLDGKTYSPGEIIESATSPCLRCRCGEDGSVNCDHIPCVASRLEKERYMKPPVEKPVVNIQKYKLNELRMKKEMNVDA